MAAAFLVATATRWYPGKWESTTWLMGFTKRHLPHASLMMLALADPRALNSQGPRALLG